jgi:DNA-binding MarR family transcriptional regulator
MERDLSLLDALVQVSFEVTAILSQVAGEHDLSLTQLRLLAILRDRSPRMSELADHLGLDRSTISGLVDRAARRGLVERVADSVDRRSARVALTEAGRELTERGGAEVARRTAPLLARLGAADQRRLAGLLAGLLD